jgi:hypothetical protein
MKTGDESEEDVTTFRFWPHRKRKRDEIDAEIRSHLQMAARDRIERGEIRRQAVAAGAQPRRAMKTDPVIVLRSE